MSKYPKKWQNNLYILFKTIQFAIHSIPKILLKIRIVNHLSDIFSDPRNHLNINPLRQFLFSPS